MNPHLTASLCSSHGAGWPSPGQPVRLRIDHVLLDDDEGVVTLLAFEALARPRHACELVLVAPAREAAGPDALADQHYVRSAAAAFGAHFARPGAGPAAAVHRRRFARPGRTLLAGVPGGSACGAFAMLALDAGALECALALGGEPFVRERPPVVGARLEGALPATAGAAELLAALLEALPGALRGTILELHGPGVASVPMHERLALCEGAARHGVLATLWPSDDVTRAALQAYGRESDWRRLEGAGEGFEQACTLALESLEARVPRSFTGTHGARLGALADDDALRALAAALAGRTLATDRTLEIVAGGRAARVALAAEGTFALLAACGAQVLDMADARALAPLPAGTLARGESASDAAEAGTFASLAAIAAWALGDAAVAALPVPAPRARGAAALEEGELLEPAPPGATSAIERGAAHRVPAPGAPLAGARRGVVLLVAGDDADASQLLPWGPRAHAARGDARALAPMALRGLDADAAARALALGGGVLVAGERFGAGAHHEAAARAFAALSIGAVLARSFDPAHERALAHEGVLPLRVRGADDAAALAPGTELELAGLPEALAPGRRMLVRDLTHGRTFAVEHGLSADLLEVVCAGGLLGRFTARALEPAGGSLT